MTPNDPLPTYELDRIADLLRVPVQRRAACLRELEYALDLHELAFGEQAAEMGFSLVWTDDGDKSVEVCDANGKPVLTLEVTDAPNVGPLDRYVIGEGQTCWFTGETCDCGEAMATDGARTWCHAGCVGVRVGL